MALGVRWFSGSVCLRRMRSIVEALMPSPCSAAAASTCPSSRNASIWRFRTVARYRGVMRPDVRQRRRSSASAAGV